MKAVAVSLLCKSYADNAAVEDLSFSVETGEILGLIGPNGAGKSSTIKMILDFMKPDAGEVQVFGHRIGEADKNRLGYLPEEKGLYRKFAALDLIVYLATLKGMGAAAAAQQAEVLLRRTGMYESRKLKIKQMSKGMGQMIQFIVTIVHDPELLILDEPFSGLDPVNTELMKTMIGELRDAGKAIILSTHQMNQVEELCDRVLMIDHGQAVLYGDLQEIRASFRKNSVRVAVEGELGDLAGVVESKAGKETVELMLEAGTTPQDVLDRLRERGVTVNRFEAATPSLNQIFLSIAGASHE
ncbi:MAG: ATP-binding cassette domain-containing protein [bacterium]|nr:ATP-binding cassette domain-containing protein [bacterium]